MIYYDGFDGAHNTPEYVYDTRNEDLNKLSDFIASTKVEEEKKIGFQKNKNNEWFGAADNLVKICEYYIARFLHHKSEINSKLKEMENSDPESVDFLLLWLQEINSNNSSIYQDKDSYLEIKAPNDWHEYIVYDDESQF